MWVFWMTVLLGRVTILSFDMFTGGIFKKAKRSNAQKTHINTVMTYMNIKSYKNGDDIQISGHIKPVKTYTNIGS